MTDKANTEKAIGILAILSLTISKKNEEPWNHIHETIQEDLAVKDNENADEHILRLCGQILKVLKRAFGGAMEEEEEVTPTVQLRNSKTEGTAMLSAFYGSGIRVSSTLKKVLVDLTACVDLQTGSLDQLLLYAQKESITCAFFPRQDNRTKIAKRGKIEPEVKRVHKKEEQTKAKERGCDKSDYLRSLSQHLLYIQKIRRDDFLSWK